MNIQTLKEQIIKKNLGNFYIFVGEEIGIMNIYLNQMSKTLNLPIQRAENVLSIYSKCTSRSMFGSTVGFYVIRDDFDFQKQDKYFDSVLRDLGKNVVVLLYTKLDSRLKFSKHFKDYTVPFEKLSNTVLVSYIQKACGIGSENAKKLSNVCEGSYDVAMLESDKITQYRMANKISADASFEALVKDGSIYQPETSDVFQFTSAVCNNEPRRAVELAQVLSSNGGSAINILGTLYVSLKSVMLIQCCEGNVSEVTGLDKGQIYFNRKYVGKHSTEWLVDSVRLVYRVISGIKNGWIDEKYATEFVLAKIM